MSFREQNAWALLVTTLLAGVAYGVILLPQLRGADVAEVRYQPAMLTTLGVAVVVQILVSIVVAITAGRDGGPDERDRAIERFSGQVGHAFVVIAALGALALAMLEAQWFWIANALYLGFMLSGVVEAMARIAAYRRGFDQW
jgi:uncharacterized membrane protein HdeD (DUF308 family)